MFSGLRESFHKLENKPKAVELAQIVSTQRPRFLLESLRRERRVIAIVLDYGRKTGEFVFEDVSRTAATLQAATMKYHYPQLFTHQTLQELEAELSAMLKLFFAGLINSDYEEIEEITEKTLSF
jgi:Ni,Fe-hydrogenase maturation factor